MSFLNSGIFNSNKNGIMCGNISDKNTITERNTSWNDWSDLYIQDNSANLFLSTPYEPHDSNSWPTIYEVLRKINDSEIQKFIVVIHNVIIAVPDQYKIFIKEYCQKENNIIWKEKKIKESHSHWEKAKYHFQRSIVNFCNK